MKQVTSIKPITIRFKGKAVNARIISVTSTFNYNHEFFFEQELVKANTLEIVKPLAKIRFIKQNNNNPLWQQGFNYELEIKPFGLMNIWGIHHIKVVSIDTHNKIIVTEEKNNICKVWDHMLTFKKINDFETEYTDSVILYADKLTRILSRFLVFSYKMRHKKWNKRLAMLDKQLN